MVADLVRDDISVGEVAAAAIFGLHVMEERHVEIDRLVHGAIERPHRRLRAAATGIGRAVIEHQFRVDVSHALLRGQHFLPDRLGLAEHVANEARHAIFGAAGDWAVLGAGALALVLAPLPVKICAPPNSTEGLMPVK